MRVSVEVPTADPLLKQLLKQFETLQQQLLKQRAPDTTAASLIKAFGKQQDALVKSMEKVLARVGQHPKMPQTDMTEVLRSLKKTMAALPDSLSEALDGSYRTAQRAMVSKPQVTVKPEITVSMNGMNKQLRRIEEALVSSKRGRSRTFGSNY